MGSLDPKALLDQTHSQRTCQGPVGRYIWRIVFAICFFSAVSLGFRYWATRGAQHSLLYVYRFAMLTEQRPGVKNETSMVNRDDERASGF